MAACEMRVVPLKDPLAPVRRERLQAYCKSKGWMLPNERWNTAAIALAMGKSVTKASNLIHGTGSFGAKIAREIEDAMNLPGGYLDGLGIADWPFSPELLAKVLALDEDGLWFAENALRSHFHIDPLPRPVRKRRA